MADKKDIKANAGSSSCSPQAAEAPACDGAVAAAEFERLLQNSTDHNIRYVLKLYVTGTTHRAAQAVSSIRGLCEEKLAGRYDLEVIDIYQQPEAASSEQIIAAPTLIKSAPAPIRRVVGNLTDRNKILLSLNLHSGEGKPGEPHETQWVEV
ncbi:MAG TPA: circadian clock KaiB family protein [Prosthecobacter sp.]